MENKKPWYLSKTIWGLLISLIGFIGSEVLRVPVDVSNVDSDTQALLDAAKAIKDSSGSLEVIISQGIGVIGAVIALYGRVKADTVIK